MKKFFIYIYINIYIILTYLYIYIYIYIMPSAKSAVIDGQSLSLCHGQVPADNLGK